MRKNLMFALFLIIVLSGIGYTTCFATENSYTLKWDTNNSLTKNIIITSDFETTINWGDGNTTTVTAGTKVENIHNYNELNTYTVTLVGNTIKELDISYNDISEINLSQGSELEVLNISGNKVSSLDFSKNTFLVELNCDNNNLISLDLSNTKIKILHSDYNIISDLSLANTIEEIYANGNKLSTIDNLENYTNLKVLKCSDNVISTLDLSKCTNLISLICSNNLIGEIDISTNTLLETLEISGNSIEILSLATNTKLKELNCENNNLSTLDISNNVALEKLYANNNTISSINFSNNSNVVLAIVDNGCSVSGNASSTVIIKLEIDGNGIFYIDEVMDAYFYDISELKSVVLNGVTKTVTSNPLSLASCTGINTLQVAFNTNTKEVTNVPQILDGMIPLKYNGKNWVITNAIDTQWYNYSASEMKWANVMLRDGAKYIDVDGTTLVSVGDTPLENLIGREVPSSSTGSMYVWIPRFSYKVENNQIDIKFSDGIIDDNSNGYLSHPAFNYSNYLGGNVASNDNYENGLQESDKYLGIWVSKYAAGGDISTPKYSQTASKIQNVTISEAFLASKKVTIDSTYGLDSGISHMIKNSEWGAVAYFTTFFGALGNESTTNNVYGIYGMDSGAEFVSNYIQLIGGISNYNVRNNGKSLIPYSMLKYNHLEGDLADIRDIDILELKSATDSADSNYDALDSYYGFAINEIDSNITGSITKNMPTGSNAFFVRGIDGIYSYSNSDGGSSSNIGFRNVILAPENTTNISTVYTIIANVDGNGTISPSGNMTILEGNDITYTIKADSGYELIDVIVDGKSVIDNVVKGSGYATYTFSNVLSNHVITATFDFEITPFEVTVEVDPLGAATVEGVGTYNYKELVILNATLNNGYSISSWEVLDNSLELATGVADEKIIFKMPHNDVKLKLNLSKEALLTVKGGYMTTSGYEMVGTEITVDAEVKNGYTFTGWIVNGITLTADEMLSTSITFIMPDHNVEITATYGEGGQATLVVETINSEVAGLEYIGKTVSVSAAVVSGYQFDSWSVTGLSLTSSQMQNSTITFTMPSNNVVLTANYSQVIAKTNNNEVECVANIEENKIDMYDANNIDKLENRYEDILMAKESYVLQISYDINYIISPLVNLDSSSDKEENGFLWLKNEPVINVDYKSRGIEVKASPQILTS